ncbi:MAG: cyclophilin-like fold protein [Chloroflexi bacterium]|nr:cyclophilin-like fold protein [Chloroflexota bacterium]
MNRQIKIVVGGIEVEGWLNKSDTARMVFDALPITSEANLWGDEIYFYVSLQTALEDGKETVALGDIAYWTEGPALCIFLGKTPISRGNEIRPASAVNIIGKISGIKSLLGKVKDGSKITVRR